MPSPIRVPHPVTDILFLYRVKELLEVVTLVIAVVVENTFAYQTTRSMINIATAGRALVLYTERSTK